MHYLAVLFDDVAFTFYQMAYVKVGGFDNIVERCDTASKTALNPEECVACIIN